MTSATPEHPVFSPSRMPQPTMGTMSLDSVPVSLFFLVPEFSASGDAATARMLATALPPDRFKITLGILGAVDPKVRDECDEAGVIAKSVPIRHAFDLSGTRRLRNAVRECGAQLIHSWGASAARVARSLVSRHREEGNQPRLVVSSASNTGGGLRGWLAARQIRRADRVTPNTRADGDRYRRLGVPAEQLTLISPAAPARLPPPDRKALGRELDIPAHARLIVVSGRSEAGTGPKDAIVAFDMLRYDAKDLYLLIVGAGGDTSALEQFGHSLAFDDFRIRFAPSGLKPQAVVQLADAVLATSPSTSVELALEAMAASKPVVGWDTTDLTEIVDDKVTGVLVSTGDRAALAACTRAVLDNSAYARRLGEAGRARAVERFGLARLVEQFARLYHELAMA